MEWHVWDFPDNIRVYFDSSFRELLYKKLIKICRTRIEIARRLGTNKETIRRSLCLGYRDKKEAYTSVKIIKRIIEIFGNELGDKFLENLEMSIVCYRAWNGWNVKNSILPIKEEPKFYSIAFHLIGDGNASLRHSPFYSNKCKGLLDEFKIDLQFFGNVETRTVIREDGVVKIYFPKAIADILSYVLEIEFTHPQKLPERIFQASKECKIAAIRAFVDDEGSISSSFCISQRSSNILKQLKEVLESLDIKSGKVCREDDIHKIYISKYSYKKFKNSINLTHPKKYRNLVNKASH